MLDRSMCRENLCVKGMRRRGSFSEGQSQPKSTSIDHEITKPNEPFILAPSSADPSTTAKDRSHSHRISSLEQQRFAFRKEDDDKKVMGVGSSCQVVARFSILKSVPFLFKFSFKKEVTAANICRQITTFRSSSVGGSS